MSKEVVKVLGAWPTPFVMRPRIALHLKSIEYEVIEETMNPKSELLLKSNPIYKKIPVLIHNNDKLVNESLIIVQYIDEAFSSGPSILPSDPYDRSIQRFWAAYLDNKWFPSFQGVTKAQTDEAKAKAIEEVKEGLSLLEDAFVKCSKGKPFFSGDMIGYLDIVFGSFLGSLRVLEKNNKIAFLNQEKTPNILVWAERFCADDAVKDYMPEADEFAEFAKMITARFKAAAASSN